MQRNIWVLLSALLLLPQFLQAQLGTPYLQQYTARDYGAAEENMAAAINVAGLLYVANGQALLEYDGQTWRKVHSELKLPVTQLALGPEGRLYAANERELAVLIPGASGAMQLQALTPEGKPTTSAPISIGKLTACADGVYASTPEGALYLSQGKARWATIDPSAKRKLDYKNLLHVPALGFVHAQQGVLAPWPGGRFFMKEPVRAHIALRGGWMLVFTERGMHLFNGWTVRPLRSAAYDFAANNLLSAVCEVSPGIFALATLRGGLGVCNASGQLLTRIDRFSGLQNETVLGVGADREGGVWLCLQNGLTRANLLTPLTFFNASTGLKGEVNTMLRYNDTLYVGTSLGLYWLDTKTTPNQFVGVRSIVSSVVGLAATRAGLMATTQTGIFIVKGLTAKRLRSWPSFCVLPSNTYKGSIFIGLQNGMAVAEQVRYLSRSYVRYGNKYVPRVVWADSLKLFKLPGIQDGVQALTEETTPGQKTGALWAQTANGFLQLRWLQGFNVLPEIRLRGTQEGLTLPNPKLIVLGTRILAQTKAGIHEWNPKQEKFEPERTLAPDSSLLTFVHQDVFNDRLLLADGDLRYGAWQPYKRTYVWDSTALQLGPGYKLRTAYRDNQRQFWLGFDKGLVLFEPNRRQRIAVNYRTLLRAVTGTNDSLLYNGALPDSLPQASDSLWHIAGFQYLGLPGRLAFAVAAPRYGPAVNLTYRFALQDEQNGKDSLRWGVWQASPQYLLMGLDHGRYALRMQARDQTGRLSTALSYHFRLVPPWYTRTWAWLLFILAGGGLLYGVGFASVHIYGARLRAYNHRLEKLIKERTTEIREKNDELEKSNEEIFRQKEVIEEKNQDLMDSISYAKRIQEAMLPKLEFIKQYLQQFFILYLPRDIVSGDFYWFHPGKDEILLAVGDCTGHGVPGALMSMIGSSLLTQIVTEQETTQPDKVLQALHQGIHTALGHHLVQLAETVNDTIEITFIRINLSERKLYAASANRPILCVRDGELTEVRGEKYPVGSKTNEAYFALHTFDITEGSAFYFFTDGYPDQFGGANARKLQTRRFKELVQQYSSLSMAQQSAKLASEFDAWRGRHPQLDDVLVVGLRF